MAAFFIGLVVTIVKSQGGPNKAKEDAAVDSAISRAEAVQKTRGPTGSDRYLAYCHCTARIASHCTERRAYGSV